MFLSVLAVFALALLAPLGVRLFRGGFGWLLGAASLGLSFYYASFVPAMREQMYSSESIAWLPDLGINLSFYLDGLSLLFVLLISFIGAFIMIYAGGYLKEDKTLGKFFFILLSFMAAMLGLVLTDNLIVLFVFWELTSITSYFLVAYKHSYESSRSSALQALLVTGSGGLAMLAGFLLLGNIAASYQISELAAQADLIQASPLFAPMLILVLLGALTKSAQFPFHFWLPNAMAAPTPVSAYLHSATMVKAGIYLLARLSVSLGGGSLWFWILAIAGTVTVLTAAILALKQTDLKKLLAYSTLVALGMLTMLLAIGDKTAVKAAMVFLLAHSLYKAALFMGAGTIDYQTGTRDIRQLAGLGRVMPMSFVGIALAALSLAGLPPKLGFIGKELAYEAFLGTPFLLISALIANSAMFVVAILVSLKPFLGKTVKAPQELKGAALSLYLGPISLSIIGLIFALFPEIIELTKLPAVAAVLGETYDFNLYLFPSSFTPALGLSILTVLLGLILYALWPRIFALLERISPSLDIGPAKAYANFIKTLPLLAKNVTKAIQGHSLSRHLLIMLTFTVALVSFTLLNKTGFPRLELSFDLTFYEVFVLLLCAVSAVTTVLARSKLVGVVALGVLGFSVALCFVLFSAPDLAITQLVVETLLVIIVVLVMIRLPELPKQRSFNRVNAVVSLAAGILITSLLLIVLNTEFNPSLSEFFEAESVPSGFGRNIVNVILVDFRAIDTLGEIVVLSVAALGVMGLLRRAKKEQK